MKSCDTLITWSSDHLTNEKLPRGLFLSNFRGRWLLMMACYSQSHTTRLSQGHMSYIFTKRSYTFTSTRPVVTTHHDKKSPKKVTLFFSHVITWCHMTNLKRYVSNFRSPMETKGCWPTTWNHQPKSLNHH